MAFFQQLLPEPDVPARTPGRKIRLAILLCHILLSGPLSAQIGQGISIFIPPVTEIGGIPGDGLYFTDMLLMEVAARNYRIAETIEAALYSLSGTVSPADILGEGLESFYALHLALVDNETEEVMVEQYLVYSDPEEINELFPVLVFNMLANIPPLPPPESSFVEVPDDWRQKWWYFAAYGFWSPRLYSGTFRSASMANFGLGLSTELHPLNFLSLEAGVELANDWVVISPEDYTDYHGQVLEIPALVKFVFKPDRHYMIEPYAGLQFNFSINGFTRPPLFSLLAGVQFGVRAGPGALFVDARFGLDLGKSGLHPSADAFGHKYRRYVVKIGLGYKIGVFLRNKPKSGDT